jgi:hypothetical protein
MQVFIKASNISGKLGEEFSVFGSLTPESITILSRQGLLIGSILSVVENETKLIVSPLELNINPFEVNINSSNIVPFEAVFFSETDFRPLDENGEITYFREEVFPQEKIEEIEEATTNYPILLDFFNKSISFTFTDFDFELENGIYTVTKIAKNQIEEEEEPLESPFLISTEFFDINGRILSMNTEVEIFDPQNLIYYKISKDSGDTNYKIKEYIQEISIAIQEG